jgi:hypothetical protein
MKKLPRIMIDVSIALVLLTIGFKLITHFFGKMEEDESSHREPYQPD